MDDFEEGADPSSMIQAMFGRPRGGYRDDVVSDEECMEASNDQIYNEERYRWDSADSSS